MPSANHHPDQDDVFTVESPSFTNDQVKDIADRLYGLKGDLYALDSERDQNFRIDTAAGDQFVIKIANRAEDPAILDMQIKAMEHISSVDPDLPIPKVLLSLGGLAIENIQSEDGAIHAMRVLTYLTGTPPKEVPTDQALHRPMGTCLARLVLALRGFFHPSANYELLWDLKHTSKLREYAPYVTDKETLELVNYFLDRFDRNVLPEIPKLRAQIVHNDFVPYNLLVAEDDPGRIVGILDFGDLIHTLSVNDLATSIAPTIVGHADLVDVAAEIIAAYNERIPLDEGELRVLYDLIAARLTMLYVIAAWRSEIHPYNREYIGGGMDEYLSTLERWRALDPAEASKRFFRASGLWELDDPISTRKVSKETLESHLSRRERLLGPCAYLFYDRPLHIVRGEGVWLYDDKGDRYLDVYNNVPQVGHCHPHVVNAIAKQARRLNTSTRYAHGLILELAERITSRLPEPLRVCMFVCTGTEANELAWRMAKLVSGNDGALITGYSYHGNSDAIIEFSSEEISQEKLPAHVATIFPPLSNSTFREPDAGIRGAIESLEERGHRPAMLILDTGFTSDGIYTSPAGYLSTLFDETRRAGGLCVSDEVQSGFGRLGQHFWGFEFDDVVPDIATMGKPMGNGHPLAAVVTRREIAEALAAETGYFNTFGGNPVSCAAGLATLEVIEKEELQQNAVMMGNYLIDRVLEIKKNYPILGKPHGAGLLLGIDILTKDGSPDPDLAKRVMNEMRQNGVLIGTTGPNGNVLKIRPPLVFNQEHAELLLLALKNALDKCI